MVLECSGYESGFGLQCEIASSGAMTLYQRVLGERFDTLHPTLQRFHGSPHGGRGVGCLRVTRAPGGVRWFLATLMRLPASSDAMPVTLKVLPEKNGERWKRHFGHHRFVTLQTEHEGLLLETAWPLRIGFELVVDSHSLRFVTQQVWLLWLPLPRPLRPAVTVNVLAHDDGWFLGVHIRVPLLGELVRYEGDV
jgi:hypothetical protein